MHNLLFGLVIPVYKKKPIKALGIKLFESIKRFNIHLLNNFLPNLTITQPGYLELKAVSISLIKQIVCQ